jgi:dihydropyrimidinase
MRRGSASNSVGSGRPLGGSTATFDLIVRGGLVATASDTIACDIGVRGGKVAALGDRLSGGEQVIDATGMIVTPGGVDAHCHLDQPTTDGSVMADDFHSGSIAAAFGGTTTVIPFVFQPKGQRLRPAVADYHRRAEGKAVIDYGFHLIVTDPSPPVLKEDLPTLVEEGYSSFKVYMTYDELKLADRQVLELLALARRTGALVMVHAENDDCIAWLTDLLESQGQTSPFFHTRAHTAVVEREATHRAVALSEIVDVPILIVHVSGADAAAQIRAAQARGRRIYGETCPQYLFLTADDLEGSAFHGAKCVCSPPPRDKSNQSAIWNGLIDGTFTIFSSDHAPFRFDDPAGKKAPGAEASFRNIPNGVPGIETRMALLFSEGVNKARISLNRFVELTATNPAKLYGLHPRKGTIAVGGDADLVIWDPDRRYRLTNATLHHNVDYTPYEGMDLRGAPTTTISRGVVVCRDGKLLASPGRGQFLPRGRSAVMGPCASL